LNGIFSTGINIKSLRYLILASPFKSKIRVLQSIGRTLRLHADKVNGAIVFDPCDNTKYLREHSDIRMKHYAKENFDLEELYFMEGEKPSF
jgi:superfamily II DNA or RNA helicase